MLFHKLNVTAAVVLALALVCGGSLLLARRAAANPPAAPHPDQPWAPPKGFFDVEDALHQDPAIWREVLAAEKQSPDRDAKRMQGEWRVLYALNTEPNMIRVRKGWRAVVSGGEFVLWDDDTGVPAMKTTFVLPGSVPAGRQAASGFRCIEFTYTKTNETVRGIYRLGDGDEEGILYLVVNDDPKDVFPTQYTCGTTAGDKSPNNHLLILKRKTEVNDINQDGKDAVIEAATRNTLTIDAVLVKVDAKAGALYAATGEGVLVDNDDNGDIKIWFDKAQQLENLPVSNDAVIQDGGKDVSLARLKTGTRVSLELASDGNRLVVVGVRGKRSDP